MSKRMVHCIHTAQPTLRVPAREYESATHNAFAALRRQSRVLVVGGTRTAHLLRSEGAPGDAACFASAVNDVLPPVAARHRRLSAGTPWSPQTARRRRPAVMSASLNAAMRDLGLVDKGFIDLDQTL